MSVPPFEAALSREVAFTVVIPAYNPGALLAESLESVAAQSRRPARVVIVDDGSSDETADTADALLARLDLPGQVIRQTNQGISAARNAGIAARGSEWVALLDADDLWLPDHLEGLGNAIALCPGAVVAFGDSRFFGDADAPPGPIARRDALGVVERSVAPDVHVLSSGVFDALLPGLFIPVSASAFRANVAGREMRFDCTLRTGEDRYLFLQFSQAGPFVFVDRQTARTRRHANNTTHHSQEARLHDDLLTLLIRIERSGDFRLDDAQRRHLARLTGAAVDLLMYSSSCQGLRAHLRARRRVALEARPYRRAALRDAARAVAIGAGLIDRR